MVEKKSVLIFLSVLFAFAALSFVSAVTELNSSIWLTINPADGSGGLNLTSTLDFVCNTSLNTTTDGANGLGGYNVSLYYNVTGGAAGASVNSVIESNSSRLTIVENTTAEQGDFRTYSVSTTALPDGLWTYNFSCMADNGTDQEWSEAYANISIINTPAISVSRGPTETDNGFYIFNSTLDAMNNYGNFSGNFSFNVTVNISIGSQRADEFGFLDSVYFNLSKSGAENKTWQSHSAPRLPFTTFAGFNETIDTLDLGYADAFEGYSLCIYANDTLGINTGAHVNNTECYTFTIDNNAPVVVLTKNTAGTSSDAIQVTINPGENGAGLNSGCSANRGTLSALSITEKSLDCGTSYTYTVSCTDYMNLVGSASTSFSTDECPGSPAGGAGGTGGAITPLAKTYTATETQITTGYTKQIAENEKIKLTLKAKEHLIEATEITASSITIKISSEPITSSLSIGQEKNFDVDNDGVLDLSVKLNSIVSSKADVTIKSITTEKAAEIAAQEAAAQQAATPEAKSLLWLWILIGIVVVVIIYIAYKKAK